jgi:fatty-acid desaturase
MRSYILSAYTIPLTKSKRLNWPTALVLLLLHIGAVAALFMFSWKALLVAVVLHWMAVGWGISLGYHRLHTHQSYQTFRWIEYLFAICGTMTLEGGPIFWVGTHRIHHAKSDQPGDPHSPRDGAFWAHMGWILWGETNHNNTKVMAKYTPDLAKHKFYLWLNTYHWVPVLLTSVILLAWGGLPMFLWGVCLRIVFGLHVTWFVNSAAHMFGRRRFETRDTATNCWWVALLTFGEGWHNNHHAHPTSARQGLAWYEFDPSWITLNIMKRLGLVWNIRAASVDTAYQYERKAA